jgi:ketol-acid reductoisomerase
MTVWELKQLLNQLEDGIEVTVNGSAQVDVKTSIKKGRKIQLIGYSGSEVSAANELAEAKLDLLIDLENMRKAREEAEQEDAARRQAINSVKPGEEE